MRPPFPNWGEQPLRGGRESAQPSRRIGWCSRRTSMDRRCSCRRASWIRRRRQCAGLEGDAAGDAKCNIVINPTLRALGLGRALRLSQGSRATAWWSASSAATSTGPAGQASIRDRNRYSYLAPGHGRDLAERLRGLPGLEGHRRLLLVDQSGIRRHRRLVWPCLRPDHQYGRLGPVAQRSTSGRRIC